MHYKAISVKGVGGPEVIQIVERELRPPEAGEARLRVLAAPVAQDDVAVRLGTRPKLPKFPFTPGYSVLGTVDALGPDAKNVAVGDRVVALVNFGAHAEYIYWKAEELVPVPEELDPGKAVTLILNYLVAYQIMHRVVNVKGGDKVLIIGASGGCGTAFMDLGRLAGLKMYGLASAAKHDTLHAYGTTPIDYRTQDFIQVLAEAEPEGLDYVFNGMDEAYFERGLKVLRRGGVLVHYGGPLSMGRLLVLIARLLWYNLLPNGKKIEGYGTHRLGVNLFAPDWTELFRLLGEEKIDPIIATRLPLLEAPKAYKMLESGGVTGTVVLLAPELLEE